MLILDCQFTYVDITIVVNMPFTQINLFRLWKHKLYRCKKLK